MSSSMPEPVAQPAEHDKPVRYTSCQPWCTGYGSHPRAVNGYLVHQTHDDDAAIATTPESGPVPESGVALCLVAEDVDRDRSVAGQTLVQVYAASGETLRDTLQVTPDAAEMLADLAPQLRRYAAWARANTAEAPVEVSA